MFTYLFLVRFFFNFLFRVVDRGQLATRELLTAR